MRQGLLEKADPGDSKKALYQVSERFFNIWYLMRASRRVRTKLRWFVEFLRVFFVPEELEHMAWKRLEGSRRASAIHPWEIETFFAYAIASGRDLRRFEEELGREFPDLEEKLQPYFDAVRSQESHAVVTVADGIEATDAFRDSMKKLTALLETTIHSLDPTKRSEVADAEATLRRVTALVSLLVDRPAVAEAKFDEVFDRARDMDPQNGGIWGSFGVFLASKAGKPERAHAAFRKSLELAPDNPRTMRNLGVLLYCEMAEEREGIGYIRRAQELVPEDPVSAAILAACVRGTESERGLLRTFLAASSNHEFWDEVRGLCETYAPFGKILVGICDLVLEQEIANKYAPLHRAVGIAQIGDFPRASVALEDALTGDPIDQFAAGRKALEAFLAAAVKNERVRDCIELLDRKGWKDAWRPIYEALMAVEEGSGEYLKRVAVEIREPALKILRRIAPELPGLPTPAPPPHPASRAA